MWDFPNAPVLSQTFTPPGGSAPTYTWNGEAWIKGASPSGPGQPYVLRAGDTMSGFLTLNADPTAILHAATKRYVDSKAGLPLGGLPGQALVLSTASVPTWGAAMEGGNF